jgi:hypothetical protein
MSRIFNVLHLSLVFLCACGANYRDHEIKQYVLGTACENQQIVRLIKRLVSDFNAESRHSALKFVDNIAEANSAIVITRGLTSHDGNLGYGQWLADIDEENRAAAAMSGRRPDRVTSYSMRIEFDEQFMLDHLVLDTEEKHNEIHTLFYHEVGHGLQMDHDTNPRSIMYEYVSNDRRDNATFFGRVRQFFGI